MKQYFFKTPSYLIYLFIFTTLACAQETVNLSADVADSIDADADRKIRIYRNAMLQGATDDIRVDAAVGLLLQNNKQSQETLLSTLKSKENPQAREAVCIALIKSRGLIQTIHSNGDFREPLLTILHDESVKLAELAAEALLAFEYTAIADSLDRIIQDDNLNSQVRMNAIYALKLRTEPKALRSLIQLLDNPNPEVAKAAETALQEAFGIPVGTNRSVWSGILDELQLKNPDDIKKERLLRQETKLRQVQAERDRWKKLYFSALNRQYDALDETSQEGVILDMIGSDLEPIRIWALERTSKYPSIGERLREKLLSLLSDSSRDVRLQTARVLINMSALNPAPELLARFRVEENPEVKLTILEALGEACLFAFSPGSDISLPEDIKLQTLEIASEYLQSDSANDTVKAAVVIRKILGLNMIEKDSTQMYLELLYRRYEKSISQNLALRADLLAILAHLCGQGGARDAACALFKPLFIDALDVQDDPNLRLAAVQGISYVDRVEALELFKQKNLIDDQNIAVQQVVINVAAQAGNASDLQWLLSTRSVNGHSDRVWEAIRNICQRQEVDFLLDWLPQFEDIEGIRSEYVHEILKLAEQKAGGRKDTELLKRVREKTIAWHSKRKSWEPGAAYLSSIDYSAAEKLYSYQTDLNAFQIYLYNGLIEKAAEFMQTALQASDIEQNSPLTEILNNYFSATEIENTSKVLFLEKIASIPTEDRPNWTAFTDNMGRQLNPPPPPAEAVEPKPTASAPEPIPSPAPGAEQPPAE